MKTDYALKRRDALNYWKSKTKRVFKISDNFMGSMECSWQNRSYKLGFKHVSIFCSIGQFASHITDLLRDFRFDRYNFDQSEQINEVIFRYYCRIFLIASEIFTDFQDLYILADEKISTKDIRALESKDLRLKQDNARTALANGSDDIKILLDFINKICKHKTSNFHICNNHIKYIFDDFHSVQPRRKMIELSKINSFTGYDRVTLIKHNKPEYIRIPKLTYIIDLITNGYDVLDKLFLSDPTKFDFVSRHYEDLNKSKVKKASATI